MSIIFLFIINGWIWISMCSHYNEFALKNTRFDLLSVWTLVLLFSVCIFFFEASKIKSFLKNRKLEQGFSHINVVRNWELASADANITFHLLTLDDSFVFSDNTHIHFIHSFTPFAYTHVQNPHDCTHYVWNSFDSKCAYFITSSRLFH